MFARDIHGTRERNTDPERYRSGHNEAVLKTVCPNGHMGSNPILSAQNTSSCFTNKYTTLVGIFLEKYPRGRRGSPGKGVGRENRREGSNPSFSAQKDEMNRRDLQMRFVSFFCSLKSPGIGAEETFQKVLWKSCWQSRNTVISYRSCRRWGKQSEDSGPVTCPAGVRNTFPTLYENKTEMQPWIYSLYLEAFERKQRSYILKDRAMKRHGEWGNSENMNSREYLSDQVIQNDPIQ